MRLNSLEIQAFGPFSGQEIIEFSALGDNPLFLIDGSTGAGKSSILHAICYALYGETTDSDRKELGLRCDHADANVLTRLSLTFSLRGDSYRITRVPTQMRPAKRGAGQTEQKATAHLCRLLAHGKEETLVTRKKTAADLKIAEIIGLTPQQFLQVMVLPQGKFRAFLLAKSDDRQAILSTLFQTEIYKRIEQLLKDQATAIEKQHQTFEDRKLEALAELTIANIDELEQEINKADSWLVEKLTEKNQAAIKKQQAATALETATNLSNTFITQDNKQKLLAQCRLRADEINHYQADIKRAEKAATLTPQWQILQTVLKDITVQQEAIVQAKRVKEEIHQRVNTAEQLLQQANKAFQQRDTLKAEEIVITGYQSQLVTYQSLTAAALSAEQCYQAAISQKATLAQQSLQLTQALKSIDGEIEVLEQSIVDKADVVERRLIAAGQYKKREELETVRADLQHLTKAYQKQQTRFDLAEKAYNQAEKDYHRVEMHWFANQAAVLAEKLEEDQPCVVCGSLSHPNPANFTGDFMAISQATVDKAKAGQVKKNNALATAKEELQDCLYAVNHQKKQVHQLEVELAEAANQSIAEVKQLYTDLEQTLKTIELNEKKLTQIKLEKTKKEHEIEPIVDKIKTLDSQIPELIANQATAQNELNHANHSLPENYRSSTAIKSALADISQKITALETRQATANKALTHALTDESAIQSKLEELTDYLDQLNKHQQNQSQQWEQTLIESGFLSQQDFIAAQLTDKQLETLRHQVKSHDDQIKALEAELNLLEAQLKGQKRPDLEKWQQQYEDLIHCFNLAETAWVDANQQLIQLTNTQKKIHQIEIQQAAIKQQYEVVGVLSKAASGHGHVRVSLERFVLGNLFDQVLTIASQRLHLMTKGQYRLIRQDEVNQKKNTTAGLDLAIDDAYTGKIRPVATLSGGESFMASLALALGLSDVVQERSGGIQLDTLFIDEGFGSLDQDSLQLAINTLIDLQSSGRSIGIISHVSELKEQMAKRIEVIGSRHGSTIKMVV